MEEHRPTRDYSEFHTEVDTNGFSAMAKIGLAYRINDAFSWRVGTFRYQRSCTLSHLRGFDYDQV
ncbi:MAG: hypothetical protein JO108_22005 [Acidobacteriaceae bacterium]|nr:hypothetical protein [Acidobacteriaceae bacterium]